MKSKIIITLGLCSLLTCCKKTNAVFSQFQSMNTKNDTIVMSQTLDAGIYAKKRIKYFLIVGKDTSQFKCIFSEPKKGQAVSIGFDSKPIRQKSKLYRQRMQELKVIVARKASKDFKLSNLDYFVFDVLSSGDLDVEITKEYERNVGSIRVAKFKELEKIIYNSSLKDYLNEIFNSYHVVVNKIDTEKLATATRKALFNESEIETDSVDVPKEVLDCMPIVVYFKAK